MFSWLRSYLLAQIMHLVQYRKRSLVSAGVVWLLGVAIVFFLTKPGADRKQLLQLMLAAIVPLLLVIQGFYFCLLGVQAWLIGRYKKGIIRLCLVVLFYGACGLLAYFFWPSQVQ
jgi:quinol-cytochrome oxidoreductase complex cytochrome b subunit